MFLEETRESEENPGWHSNIQNPITVERWDHEEASLQNRNQSIRIKRMCLGKSLRNCSDICIHDGRSVLYQITEMTVQSSHHSWHYCTGKKRTWSHFLIHILTFFFIISIVSMGPWTKTERKLGKNRGRKRALQKESWSGWRETSSKITKQM